MGPVRSTHTYVILDVSPDCYSEIAGKLREANYDHCFHEVDGSEVVNMHGIAVRAESSCPSPRSAARCPKCRASLVVCDQCFVAWCLDHQPNPLVCPGCGARPSDGTRAQETL